MAFKLLYSCLIVTTLTITAQGTITTSNTDDYVGVYDDTTSYSMFEAKQYCMVNYGSSLASIHSDNNTLSLANTRVDTSVESWIGLNDIVTESTWIWTDGTSYDYNVSWSSGQPNNNNNEDCVILSANSNEFKDVSCETYIASQFICNKEQNWRPVFKITNNLADFGDYTDSADFYTGGPPTYDNWINDISYVIHDFSANTIDTLNNYRSLVIDNWSDLFDKGLFTQVKVSLYYQNVETKFFVYEATQSDTAWLASSYLVDSSYFDVQTQTSNLWALSSGSVEREFMVWHTYGGCAVDAGWMVVAHTTTCAEWSPSEGTTIPDIRYSTQQDSNGNYILGTVSDSSANNVADTMVVYVNAIDSSTFGLTNAPTVLPSNNPTFEPTEPTSHPSNHPTIVPTGQPTNIPTTVPSNKPTTLPSTQPSNNPTIQPTNNPTDGPTIIPTNGPSDGPTILPTMTPTVYPTNTPNITTITTIHSASTAVQDGSDGSDGSKSSSSNGSGNGDGITSDSGFLMMLAVIICGFLLLLTCLCCVFIMFWFVRSKEKQKHEATAVYSQHSNLTDISSNSYASNAKPGTLQQVRSNTLMDTNNINGTSLFASNYDNVDNVNNVNSARDDAAIALEMAAATIAPQPGVMHGHIGTTNMNLNSGEDDSRSDDGGIAGAAGDIPGGGGGGEGARVNNNDTGNVMNINGKQLKLGGNWNDWNVEDVISWLKMELKNAGFEDKIILSFMNEFEQIEITGKLLQIWLKQCNGNVNLFTQKLQSKMDYSKKSMVWDVVVQAMMNL